MGEAGVTVVDVDYRLCPGKEPNSQESLLIKCMGVQPITGTENTWGKCILDAWDALKWVRCSLPDQTNPYLTSIHRFEGLLPHSTLTLLPSQSAVSQLVGTSAWYYSTWPAMPIFP
jgi:hypothetical protein